MEDIKLIIKIPKKEFGTDAVNDKFQDFFNRLKAETKAHLIANTNLVCGAYELETIDMFLKAFKNAAIEQEPIWIPVSERLPEENKTVMASTEYGVFPEARYSKKFGWEWLYDAGGYYWKELTEVTAWMPLPKKYEAESEDN